MPTSQGFRGLCVYQLAFKLAMQIYNESKHFPPEEKYSLTDQIRRASRSVATTLLLLLSQPSAPAPLTSSLLPQSQ